MAEGPSLPMDDAANSRTLLKLSSATQRSPLESNAIPFGPLKLFWEAETKSGTEVRFACPITVEAFMPSEKGGLNSKTRLFTRSDTHRYPRGRTSCQRVN